MNLHQLPPQVLQSRLTLNKHINSVANNHRHYDRFTGIHSSESAMGRSALCPIALSRTNHHLECGHSGYNRHFYLLYCFYFLLIHICFVSGAAEAELAREELYWEDIALISSILIAWIIVIAMFLKSWGSIQLIQSGEPRFKLKPKNIDCVKVGWQFFYFFLNKRLVF